MKQERPSNRDIVRSAFAAGVPREQIVETYKDYKITQTQAYEAIKRVRSLGEETYAPMPSNTPEHRRRLSEQRKGIAPKKAIEVGTTIWPKVAPLAERGFIPSEIVELTGLTRQQVYNALYDKARVNNVSSNYFSPEMAAERSRRYHEKTVRTKRGEQEQDPYEIAIQRLATQVLRERLIGKVENWDGVIKALVKNGRTLRSRTCGLLLEAVYTAGKASRVTDQRRKAYFHMISSIVEGVLYREEDYVDLNIVRAAVLIKSSRNT